MAGQRAQDRSLQIVDRRLQSIVIHPAEQALLGRITDCQTFEETLAISGVNNPASVDGDVVVRPGDQLPLVPESLLKAGLSLSVTEEFTIGAGLLYADEVFFSGTSLRSNFLCNLGYADESALFQKLPRFPFSKVCSYI